MEGRASKASFRDSLRSLLYLSIWDEGCTQAESCVVEYHTRAGLEVPADPFSVIQGTANKWAAALDDFVAPIVSHALTSCLTPATRAAEPQEQRQLYRELFLNPAGAGGAGGGGGLTEWCSTLPQKYEFLMEVMRCFMDHAVKNLQVCLERLLKDRMQLTQLTASGQPAGAIAEVLHTGADSHCGGQAVLILRMTEGYKLVYKPMGGQPALLFNQIVTLLNTSDIMQETAIPYVPAYVPEQAESLTGNTYHWAGFIDKDTCASDRDVCLFYQRAGALTAVAALLGFSDGHFENILAAGPRPYIIDCETFFQPTHPAYTSDPLQPILQTCLLQREPRAFSSTDGAWVAGWQHPPTASTASHAFAVRFERTALMSVVYDVADGRSLSSAAVPTLHGEPMLLKDYVTSFAEGFRRACDAWEALIQGSSRAELSALLHQAEHCVVRYVARATSFYVQCLRLLQQPSALVSRVAATEALQGALNLVTMQHGRSDAQDLQRRSELEDLLSFDVPAFYMCSSEPSVWLDSKGREVRQQGSTQDLRARAPMQPWNATGLLDGSSVKRLRHALPALRSTIICKNPITDMAVDRGSMQQCVLAIASEVVTSLFGPQPPASTVSRSHLYHGLSGILVFLAGVQRMQPYNSVVVGACDRIVQGLLNREAPDAGRAHACEGGFIGPASDAYGLAVAGLLTGKREWAEAARQLFLSEAVPDPAAVAADNVLDVISGTAGCALVGIALHRILSSLGASPEAQEQQRLRAAILVCGEHLVAQAQRDARGACIGWNTQSYTENPTCPLAGLASGFAHGIAGGVLTLRRLHEFTGDDRYLTLAQEAAAAEDRLFNPSTGTYSVSRMHMRHVTETDACGCSWCWGTPGVILSRYTGPGPRLPLPQQRSGQSECLSPPQACGNHQLPLPQQLSGARLSPPQACSEPCSNHQLPLSDSSTSRLRDNLLAGTPGKDLTLCCGSAGRVDIFLETMGNGSSSADPVDGKALEKAVQGMVRAYAVLGNEAFPAQHRLSLMQGISGLGYTLLRVMDPNGFPCVLSLGA